MIDIKSIVKRHILRGKTPLISFMTASAITGVILLGMIIPQTARAETFLTHGLILDPTIKKIEKPSLKVAKTIKMVITAYSSTPEQTDDTPFITASGKNVANGIVANNMLPFGTKIRIPELYRDKVFVVEDRMHQRKGKYHLDIWFSEYSQAKNFGAKITYIEVIES